MELSESQLHKYGYLLCGLWAGVTSSLNTTMTRANKWNCQAKRRGQNTWVVTSKKAKTCFYKNKQKHNKQNLCINTVANFWDNFDVCNLCTYLYVVHVFCFLSFLLFFFPWVSAWEHSVRMETPNTLWVPCLTQRVQCFYFTLLLFVFVRRFEIYPLTATGFPQTQRPTRKGDTSDSTAWQL